MDHKNLSGLELMEAVADGQIPPAPISGIVPMKIIEVSSGYIKFFASADKRHINPLGGVHGGFAATVLDSVTGCAVHTMLEAGVGYGTTDLSIKMLKAIPLYKELTAEGKVIHLSKKIGVSEGTLKDAEDNLYACATATCLIYR
ncbi:MAG TPA: PaaI family thioesterase [Deltaproteobacteria bacterium]|nr:PaaI family thioesterase [Deltaproteobacteria bacterium]